VAGASDLRAPAARNVDGHGDEQHQYYAGSDDHEGFERDDEQRDSAATTTTLRRALRDLLRTRRAALSDRVPDDPRRLRRALRFGPAIRTLARDVGHPAQRRSWSPRRVGFFAFGPPRDPSWRFSLRTVLGQGLAPEASAAALTYGFTPPRIAEVVAVVRPANVAAIRVLAKLGLAREQILMLGAASAVLYRVVRQAGVRGRSPWSPHHIPEEV
jgi:hypothetical protein